MAMDGGAGDSKEVAVAPAHAYNASLVYFTVKGRLRAWEQIQVVTLYPQNKDRYGTWSRVDPQSLSY
jgi:hypothetical protein